VLPCAIDRDTVAWVAPRRGRRVRAFSRELGAGEVSAADRHLRRGDWLDHLRGVLFALEDEGHDVGGFDLAVASEVPVEAGLSSSAALGLALVTALDAAAELGLPGLARARIAHRAESEFVGVGCGIMDQLASALGQAGAALRIDCRSLRFRTVPLPPDRVRILIAQSGVTRALGDGRYAGRRAECERARDAARRIGLVPPQGTLRDLPAERLPELEPAVDAVAFRRARHVVTENQRVDATCEALAAGDRVRAGAQLRDGMRSLREDFEVSTPELDLLCEIADAQPGVYGSRLTGAGFGGCTLHLVAPGAAEAASREVAAGFERRFRRLPPIWPVRPAAGAAPLAPPGG
jgi:galactokinase